MAYVQPYPFQRELYSHIRMKVGVMPELTSKKSISQEKPVGAINGSNKSFTLSKTPVINSELVIRNGMILLRGATNDYTITNNLLVFVEAPPTGSVIAVNYDTLEG